MDTDTFLSEIEKEKIALFNQDVILVNAIRKVLLKSIYDNGTLRKDVAPDPLRNAALGLANLAISGKGVVSNADLGEDLRGLMQGISLMEQGLAHLAKITNKKEDAPDPTTNPGI